MLTEAVESVPLAEIRMDEALDRLRVAVQADPGRIHSVSCAVDSLNHRAWLQAQQISEKVYWKARDGSLEVSGAGAAAVRVREAGESDSAFIGRIRASLTRCDKEARWYGGLAFDPESALEENWSAFGTGWFVLPHIECRTLRGTTRMYLRADEQSLDALTSLVEWVRDEASPEEGVPPPVSRHDQPPQDVWGTMIQEALTSFERERLKKIVLARKARYRFEDVLNPLALLERLEQQTTNCFHFMIQPSPKAAFVGATPERLFSRVGNILHTEAVAGTRPRGSTDPIDERLAERLLASGKDRKEHAYVRERIEQVLGLFSESVESDPEPSLLKLSRGQHLYTGFKALLREEVRDEDLLEALHPTPAVGGVPTEDALDAIRAWEPFSRGWYAGPLGWLGRDAADLCVAIRSGLVHDRHLDLYSGAGIVHGSDPDEEWSEIENKISDFIHILTQT